MAFVIQPAKPLSEDSVWANSLCSSGEAVLKSHHRFLSSSCSVCGEQDRRTGLFQFQQWTHQNCFPLPEPLSLEDLIYFMRFDLSLLSNRCCDSLLKHFPLRHFWPPGKPTRPQLLQLWLRLAAEPSWMEVCFMKFNPAPQAINTHRTHKCTANIAQAPAKHHVNKQTVSL